VTACVGEKSSFWGASSAGVVAADAPPISPNVNPAAPNAGTAAFVTRFRLEACFTRGIVASSIPLEREERSVFESTLR
jgi:hypothetical protein